MKAMSEREPLPDIGQSTVEALASVPMVAIVALLCLQAMTIGATVVRIDNAAHAAAVAWAESGPEDARRAAKRTLPGWARAGVSVRLGAKRVEVIARARTLVPGLAPRLRSHATLPVATTTGATR